jgi:hypothetical protein
MMRSLIVSTIVYVVAAYFIKRQLDDMDIPRGMTRSLIVFCLALFAAYIVSDAVDWVALHI